MQDSWSQNGVPAKSSLKPPVFGDAPARRGCGDGRS